MSGPSKESAAEPAKESADTLLFVDQIENGWAHLLLGEDAFDVPARQSYVAAVTAPGERTFALGVTSLARNLGWAVGPGLAGAAMGVVGLGAPLFGGAALKIVYDLALYASYRHVRPPEEMGPSA